MAKLTRKTFLQFGSTANPASEIGQFGSYAAPVYSNDIAVLQGGTAWARGWFAETIATNRPFIQDFNAIDYVFSYMLAYMLEMGIPEYDASTTYYKDSFIQVAGQIYISLTDSNIGNTPSSSPSNWQPGIGSKNTESPGVIKMFAGSIAPTGYLICDGQAVSRTTYAALFAICSTTYGIGDGSTTFNIPNLKGNTAVGYKSGDPDFGTLGANPGEKTHTLTVAETPAHSHQLIAVNGGGFGGGGTGPYLGDVDFNNTTPNQTMTDTILSTGGGGDHNNIQPSLVLNYIIKT